MQVCFISDAHLGAKYIADPKAHERQLCDWLDRMRGQADALYLLGDMLDYWFEYRCVVPRGHVRFFAALARWTDAGKPVYWLRGNHDMWTRGYLTEELGITVLDGLVDTRIGSERFVLEHGDGVGRRPAGFKLLRRVFRSGILRRLFAAVHPGITVRFAYGWSASNRLGRSEEAVRRHNADAIAALKEFAAGYERDRGHVDHFIFGHIHQPVNTIVPGTDSSLTVLPDCFATMGYALYDGNGVQLLSLSDDTPLNTAP